MKIALKVLLVVLFLGAIVGVLAFCNRSKAETVDVTAPAPYTQWVAPSKPAGTIFDMTGEIFYLFYSQNPDPMGSCKYTGTGALPIQRYPIVNPGDVTVGVGSVDAVFKGGRIIGNISLTVPGEISASNGGYCNSSAMDLRRSGSTKQTVKNVRIDRVWDAIRFNKETCWSRPGTCTHLVDTVWLSNVRDDCIESDLGNSGVTIKNSLFDGCFSAISNAPGTTLYNHSIDTITIDKSLIRLQGYPYKLQTNYHIAFVKQNPWLTSPKVEIYDSVIVAEHYMVGGSEATDWPWAQAWRQIKKCERNVFLWTPSDTVPDGMLRYMPTCFKVLTGAEARGYWAGAKDQWVKDHPELEKLSSD